MQTYPSTPSDSVNIVSIGANCLPKVVLCRWGVMRCREAGEYTMPLDLCYSSDDGALRAVLSDFSGLFDQCQLTVDPEAGWPRNDTAEVIFNHEAGPEWSADGFARLRERYARRATHFRQALQNGKPTVFVYCSHTGFTEVTNRLIVETAEYMKSRCHGPIHVLGILTSSAPDRLYAAADVTLLRAPLPRPGYLFHQPDDYGSEAGVAFERAIVDSVLSATHRLSGSKIAA